jgi:Ca2+-binding RTX toxin-like protein
MTTVVVNSVVTLNTALKTAVAGETIELATGTYAGVSISAFNHAGVTITSQTAAKPATILGLTVSNSSGITFSNLNLSAVGLAGYYGFQVSNSSNMVFNNVNVYGSYLANTNMSGLYITNSSNVTVSNSQFSQMLRGVVESNDTGVTVTGSKFTALGSDGIDFAGTSNVTISNNTFSDFLPTINGNHPDAIQSWTSNTTASESNISITGNTINSAGGAAIQGIFMADNLGNLPFLNVTIANNTVTAEAYNGIDVVHATGLSITGNTVTGSTANTSWIQVNNATNVTLSNNNAPSYLLSNVASLTEAKNSFNGVLALDAISSAVSYNMLVSSPLSHTLILTGNVKNNATANNLGDHITGNNAGDTFWGGAGADVIVGGTGNDTFNAGTGAETFTGGAGTNTFVFGLTSTNDTITDFHAGTHDVINLSAYINAGYVPTLQNVGANVLINLEAGHTITLLGVQANQLIHTATGLTI